MTEVLIETLVVTVDDRLSDFSFEFENVGDAVALWYEGLFRIERVTDPDLERSLLIESENE